jgi:pimeloyl-ACP methyl ester carboxylesterase
VSATHSPSPNTMSIDIRIDDLTVLHEPPRHSTRPPMLFVHGYFATAAIFTKWLPFFAARGVPAYAVNLRGREGSRAGIDLGRATMDDFVEDAAVVARQLETPVVVGHSMGGLIAQCLAARGDVRAAVLISPAPPRGITVLSPRLAIKQLKYLPSILRSRQVVPDREDLREIVLNRVPRDLQDVILQQLVPDSGRAGREMSLTGVPVDQTRVRCPLFVIGAEEDRFIPKQIAARVAQRYGAPLRILEGHAHMSVVEPGWESVAEIVDAWITEQFP